MPRAAIIIRAYNEAAHIGTLLERLAAQTERGFETILVDSGSTDETVAIAQRFPVKVVPISPQEFTFGRALNHGIQACSGKFIVMISAHCYPIDDSWLANLLAPFSDENIALSYGMQRGAPANKYSEHRFFEHYYPLHSNFAQDDPFCNNANAAIRRTLWEQRPYDETLTGLEDLAWASWVLSQGYKLAYVADACIIHYHAERWRQVFNRYKREAIAMKGILPASRYSIFTALRLFARTTLNDLRHALKHGELLKNTVQIVLFRWMQHWGTYRGYRHRGPLTRHEREVFYYSPEILTRNRNSQE